jgi:hypothetical protein
MLESDTVDADGARRISPAFPFALALLCLALILYTWVRYVDGLGFPDGFVSDLGAAEGRLAGLFQLVSFLTFLWCMFLGVASFGGGTRKHVVFTAVLYAAVTGACIVIDFYYQAHLTGGGGG